MIAVNVLQSLITELIHTALNIRTGRYLNKLVVTFILIGLNVLTTPL